jgi:hypothetical protein
VVCFALTFFVKRGFGFRGWQFERGLKGKKPLLHLVFSFSSQVEWTIPVLADEGKRMVVGAIAEDAATHIAHTNAHVHAVLRRQSALLGHAWIAVNVATITAVIAARRKRKFNHTILTTRNRLHAQHTHKHTSVSTIETAHISYFIFLSKSLFECELFISKGLFLFEMLHEFRQYIHANYRKYLLLRCTSPHTTRQSNVNNKKAPHVLTQIENCARNFRFS